MTILSVKNARYAVKTVLTGRLQKKRGGVEEKRQKSVWVLGELGTRKLL